MNETSSFTNESGILKSFSDEKYQFRYLELGDYDKGYFDLLKQLTSASLPSRDSWETQFKKIPNEMRIIVIEELETKKIIGNTTLIIESKFIRNIGIACHVEEFIIEVNHRKKGFGTKLVKLVDAYANLFKCYKIILDCSEEVKAFYEKFGYYQKSIGMAKYIL